MKSEVQGFTTMQLVRLPHEVSDAGCGPNKTVRYSLEAKTWTSRGMEALTELVSSMPTKTSNLSW